MSGRKIFNNKYFIKLKKTDIIKKFRLLAKSVVLRMTGIKYLV